MATVDITNETFEETIQNNDIVLIDAWASWCGPCRQFSPIFEKAAENHSDVVFGKLDTDANQEISAALRIQSIPTLFVFREGVLLFRHSGVLPEGALTELITQASALDMDDVRKQIAQQAEENKQA